MSRSCHSTTFSSAGVTCERTMRASPVRFSVSTGLRLCGIAEEPFWPGAKYSSASRSSVRCRWRISVARRSTALATSPSAAKKRRVPVARDDLGGDRLDREPELLRHMRLDPGVDIGERADRARDRAGRDLGARPGEAVAVARELGVVAGELEPEGRGLGVNAVAAPDAGGQPVFAGAASQRLHHRRDPAIQQIGGAAELHREAGVQHVRRGHAAMHEACLRPDMLGEVGEEGDHVVAGLALDLLDAFDLEGTALPDGFGGGFGDQPERRLRVAGMRLDLEPDAEPGLGRPERRHFLA